MVEQFPPLLIFDKKNTRMYDVLCPPVLIADRHKPGV